MKSRQLILKKALSTPGWMTENELSFLAESAEYCNLIYEIGSYCGKSTIALADNSLDDCVIHCIDPWNYTIMNDDRTFITVDQTIFGQFQLNLYNYIKSKKVIPHPVKFEDFKGRELADFIFIDGDHTYGAVKHDIIKSIELLKPGGIISGHDYNWEGVHNAVNEFFPKVSEVDSIWYTRI